MKRRSLAATAVMLGGLAVIAGSFASWATCRDSSCGGGGGLLAFFRESGFYWGPGFGTLTLGLVLAAVSIDAFRSGGRSGSWWLALGAAVSAILVAVLWTVRMIVIADLFLVGPDEGVFLITIGGLIAAVASPTLREGQTTVS